MQGDGGDGMAHHNGAQFSTFDFNKDRTGNEHCAYVHQSGWWYNACWGANLNGPHIIPSLPGVFQKWARLIWLDDNGSDLYTYVPSVELKVRKNSCIAVGDTC